MGQYPDGISPDESEAYETDERKTMRTYRTSEVWTIREVFKTSTIWFFIMVGITQGMPIIFITSHGVLHITDIGYTSMQAAYVLMFVLLGSGIARFPMGWLGDRIEPRWIVIGALSLMLIAFSGIWKAPSLNILMGFGSLFGICYGTLLVLMSTMMGNYYGPESYAGINAFTAPFLTAISASVPTVAGYIADKQGSYNLVFTVLTAGLIISVICSTFLSPPKKPVQAATK
jgi:MFS family permease